MESLVERAARGGEALGEDVDRHVVERYGDQHGTLVGRLVTYSAFYDIALRDIGLMLAVLALARLASVYDPPLKLRGR